MPWEAVAEPLTPRSPSIVSTALTFLSSFDRVSLPLRASREKLCYFGLITKSSGRTVETLRLHSVDPTSSDNHRQV